MTKLPKGLEKIIEQKAEVYGANHRHLKTSQHYRDGGTEIALEVLQRAEKLAEALEFADWSLEYPGGESMFLNERDIREIKKALSDWQAWKETK